MPKDLNHITAIHKNYEDGTIFILESNGYWVLRQDKERGEEELYGPNPYSDIKDLPTQP